MSLVLTSLARLSSRVIDFAFDRWLRNPQSFLTDMSTLSLILSCRLKHIPISNQLRLVFNYPSAESLSDSLWKDKFVKAEAARLNPGMARTSRPLRVLAKLVRALIQGLRLEHDSRVSVGYADHRKLLIGKTEPVVLPGCGENGSRELVDNPKKLWGMGFHTEHLEKLVWDLTLINSEYDNAFYRGNGKIAIDVEMLHLAYKDEELAAALAHEIGHGVAMHIEGHPNFAFWLFLLIPWTSSSFWAPVILLRVCDLMLYMRRRNELEAWYIGLMLMASAGYDPRLVPDFVKKMEIEKDDDKYLLDTTHPCVGRVAEMLSQETVMDKAVEIYEKVRAGGQVPSFVEGGERNFCSKLFNPFSVTQFFSEFKRAEK
ncbi:Unknown protein [Striga hermonthica]|uniref:Peptidase M48 domain-containing protein n=1 Tax=Striga hermonthica TaxID=68872 RepID=A0A9N7R6F5_STRHE|nr:Unknown protein [Striga hermonthica]